jgi:chromosome segregation ATPase
MVESQQTRESHVTASAPAPVLDSAMRVDPPHVHSGDPGVSAAQPLSEQPAVEHAPEPLTSVTLDQLRTQAAQLAGHLQRHQSSLDHRESEMNSRMAALENQLRSGRLWLAERHEEIAERTAALDRRELELVRREEKLQVESSKAEPPATNFHEGLAELAARKAELDRRQSELESAAAQWDARQATGQEAGQTSELLRTIEARRDNLERAEKMLAQSQSELDRQRQMLADERAEFAEHRESQRRAFEDQRQASLVEVDKARRDLARQIDEVNSRQTSLERIRTDVARAQSEALEMRLATEELWARLCGTMAPAALTRSLAQIRLQLAEEGRLAREDLAQQKAEVQTLAARVAEQHSKLAKARADLQSWHLELQKQIENKAALLAKQEQQLEAERAALAASVAEWQNERFRLQQEARRLMRQLNQKASVAA